MFTPSQLAEVASPSSQFEEAQADVSLASISIWNDSSFKSEEISDENSDIEDSCTSARSAPIPISRRRRYLSIHENKI